MNVPLGTIPLPNISPEVANRSKYRHVVRWKGLTQHYARQKSTHTRWIGHPRVFLNGHGLNNLQIRGFLEMCTFPQNHACTGTYVRNTMFLAHHIAYRAHRVEDIPGLTFLALNGVSVEPNTSAGPGLFESNTLPSDPTVESVLDTGPPPSSACHRSWRGRGTAPCNRGKGLGDAWGGGVGGGWGAGLGLWRGLRGSLVGASEFLGHLKAYLGFYHRKEAAMYTPLVEVRHIAASSDSRVRSIVVETRIAYLRITNHQHREGLQYTYFVSWFRCFRIPSQASSIAMHPGKPRSPYPSACRGLDMPDIKILRRLSK